MRGAARPRLRPPRAGCSSKPPSEREGGAAGPPEDNRGGAASRGVVDRATRSSVMPALVAGIHVSRAASKTWMAGTSPAMTNERVSLGLYPRRIVRTLARDGHVVDVAFA